MFCGADDPASAGHIEHADRVLWRQHVGCGHFRAGLLVNQHLVQLRDVLTVQHLSQLGCASNRTELDGSIIKFRLAEKNK